MSFTAQPGTPALWLMFGVLFAGCTATTTLPVDADGGERMDAGCAPLPCPSNAPWDAERCACVVKSHDDDAAISDECEVASDCTFIARGCCGYCALTATPDMVLAVAKSRAMEAQHEQCLVPPECGTSSCGANGDYEIDPLAPVLAPDCVAHRCKVVDLRQSERSHCTSDADCIAVARGCCGASSDSPSEYVGLKNGADLSFLSCSPTPPCAPPQPHGEPLAFCASDDHCAVRRREHRDGKDSDACYSPTQDLEHAYDAAAIGCDCKPMAHSQSQLPSLCTPGGVALFCMNGHWQSGEDGPCSPHQ